MLRLPKTQPNNKTSMSKSTGIKITKAPADHPLLAQKKPSQPNSPSSKQLLKTEISLKEKLLKWTQNVTAGYPNVSIKNFSTSWSDGLAFCAIIHHYFPNKIDFSKLKPENRRENFDKVFGLAKELGFEPCLDTDDMLMMGDRPDEKCVFTSLRSFYEFFIRIKKIP